MKIKTLKEYLASDISFYEYQNENFLDFLSSIRFKFDIPYIHVTGTAGKTFIVNGLFNIYQENSYNVGKITSEEINEFSDKNEKYLSFAAIFENYRKQINKFELTKYEVLFFCYLMYFKNAKKDLVVIETYMGGYNDTSNIEETPLITIFNNAGLEHTDLLGKSASEIAYEKCGIIKPETIVILNSFDEDIEYVLNEECKKTKSKLVKVAEFYDYNIIDSSCLEIQYFPFPKFTANTTALYNRENIACILEVINQLNSKLPTTHDNIQKGLLKSFGYGYFDIFKKENKTIIVDKANNPFSIEKFCKSFEFIKEDSQEKTAIIFAVDYDKNIEKMLSILSRLTHNIILTTFEGENIRDESGFFLFLEDYKYNENYNDAFSSLLINENVENVIITGNEVFAKLFEDVLGEK